MGMQHINPIARRIKMPQRTKADRSEAAKKGAATRQRNKAKDAGGDAKKAAKQAAQLGGEAVKSIGRAVKAAGKSASPGSKS
jgi:hypothetical protein